MMTWTPGAVVTRNNHAPLCTAVIFGVAGMAAIIAMMRGCRFQENPGCVDHFISPAYISGSCICMEANVMSHGHMGGTDRHYLALFD
jgi:hypothetical protein